MGSAEQLPLFLLVVGSVCRGGFVFRRCPLLPFPGRCLWLGLASPSALSCRSCPGLTSRVSGLFSSAITLAPWNLCPRVVIPRSKRIRSVSVRVLRGRAGVQRTGSRLSLVSSGWLLPPGPNLTLLSIHRGECLQHYPRLVSVPAQACRLERVFLTIASVLECILVGFWPRPGCPRWLSGCRDRVTDYYSFCFPHSSVIRLPSIPCRLLPGRSCIPVRDLGSGRS